MEHAYKKFMDFLRNKRPLIFEIRLSVKLVYKTDWDCLTSLHHEQLDLIWMDSIEWYSNFVDSEIVASPLLPSCYGDRRHVTVYLFTEHCSHLTSPC